MTTEKIGGIELYIENVDLENSGRTQKVYGTNCADDFWALLSNERSAFAYVDYLWVPPDLKRNTSQSNRALYAWRGDTRSPDEIFGHGFSRRGTSPATPAIVYRKGDQDLAHYTAVCLSGTHEIGALSRPRFPVRRNRLPKHGFIVYDCRDTGARLFRSSRTSLTMPPGSGQPNARWRDRTFMPVNLRFLMSPIRTSPPPYGFAVIGLVRDMMQAALLPISNSERTSGQQRKTRPLPTASGTG